MMASTIQVDLVILDYHMPAMNGLEVMPRLKADAKTRQIPVVTMTSATAAEANALSETGCVAFIPKPFDPRGFLRVVGDIPKATAGRTRDRRQV